MEDVITGSITSQPLPLVVEPKNKNITKEETLELIRSENKWFRDQMLTYGGLLLRNFPVNGVDDFSEIVAAMNTGKRLDYIGGDSPRDRVKGKVYTSTEASPSFKIPLHNELSYQNHYPTHIYFYCDHPPETDGETIIGDARRIYQTMDPEVRQLFKDKGLKYVSRYYHKSRVMDFANKIQRGHKSWMVAFDTESREEVERKCRENEYRYSWYPNGWLEISRIRPAAIKHPSTQEDVWFNQVHTFDFNPKFLGWWRYIGGKMFYCRKNTRVNDVYFADGSKIPRDAIYHVLDKLDDNTVKFPWKKGDVMMLDNILAMHGRSTFTGKRRILTAMTVE